MEDTKERVLGYNLARTITACELVEVSGSGGNANFDMTMRPSGGSDRGFDCTFDGIFD